ncbi:MAG: DUF6883 domain-containing protein [Hyphomicrobiaceae bacterium]
MAKLPHGERASIDDRKIIAYLLNPSHRFGGAKAVFFERFGFTLDDWQGLREALLLHARENEVVSSEEQLHGEMYEVVGPLRSPDGRNPTVLVAWMIRHGEDSPRLVTAVPA